MPRSLKSHLPALLLLALFAAHVTLGIARYRFAIVADGAEYLRMGENLLAQGRFTYDGINPVIGKPPGFPALVAAYVAVAGSVAGFQYLQLVMLFGAYLFVADAASRLAPRKCALALVAFLVAVDPLRLLAAHLISEPAFLLITSAGLWALLRAWERPGLLWTFTAGMALGLSTYLRPNNLFWPAALLAFAAVLHRTRRRTAAVVLVVHTLIVTPWLLRNAVLFGRFVPMVANWGPWYYMTDENLWRTYYFEGTAVVRTSSAYAEITGGEFQFNWRPSERFRQLATDNTRRDPGGYLYRCLRQAAFAWTYMPGTKTAFDNAPGWFILGRIAIVLFHVLALLGAAQSWRHHRPFVLVAAGYAVYTAILLFPVTTESRYLIPAYLWLLPLTLVGGLTAARYLTPQLRRLHSPDLPNEVQIPDANPSPLSDRRSDMPTLRRWLHPFRVLPSPMRLSFRHAIALAMTLGMSAFASTTSLSAGTDVADDRWQPDSAKWHWGRDRQIDLIDTKLDIKLDPAVVHVEGTATLTFVPIVPRLEHLRLDAERLVIEKVRSREGQELPFDVDEGGLEISFPSPPPPAETTFIRIDYRGEPAMGLYFIPSVREDPEKIPMIWSQGEEEENRFWFPGYDYPNDKATSAVTVTTPRPNIVISNGAMVRLDENPDGTRTFHWVEKVPNSTYLIALAVGQFDSLTEKTRDGLRVAYYCRKGEGEKLKRSLGETPGMIEFYSRMIGVPFPYEQYAQVMVTDFVYGGMENASMTTERESALYPAATADYHRDGTNSLVAHELAHQWFGDLLTCTDWAHNWLNEGFATYFEDLWTGNRWGRDRFLVNMAGTRAGGVSAAQHSRRSTIHHQYVSPGDLFDAYAYPRGASVLHMIRGAIGDSLWWAAIHRYVTDNRSRNVETIDFVRALETTTGRSWEGFFHQWLEQGGHPQLKVETAYDSDAHLMRIAVRQTQKVDAITPVFQFPLDVEWVTASGRDHSRLTIDQVDNTAYIAVKDKPRYILIDPEGWLLAEVDYKQPSTSLLEQIKDTLRVMGRLQAARQLGEKEKSTEILAALTAALRSDPMSDVREAAASSLAKLGGADARDSLFVGLHDPDARTRAHVIGALGKFENDDVAFRRLETLARSSEMDPLRAAAIEAAAVVDPDKAVPVAKWGMTQPGEGHGIATAAFSALERSKDPKLIAAAMPYTRPGNPTPIRSAAVRLIDALAKYEKDEKARDRASRALEVYLDDRNMNFRNPLMHAIGALGRPEAVQALERVLDQSPQVREQRVAKDAIAAIRERKPEVTPNTVARQLDEAAEARKKLEERIKDLEKRVGVTSAPASPAPDSTAGGKTPRN